jgi:hypothetical protein
MSRPELDPNYPGCQILSVHRFSKPLEKGEEHKISLQRKLKNALKRRVGIRFVSILRKDIERSIVWWNNVTGKLKSSADTDNQYITKDLVAGEIVRVRSEDEIRATLDRWNELKGCAFIDEMAEYCGTTQRVFKSVKRFVDERDYQAKKVRGIVLLEGAICNGTAYYGKCDRSCLYFWREEWLERIG